MAPAANPVASTSRQGGELTVAAPEIATTLDPVLPVSAVNLRSIGAGETLLKLTPDGQVVPALAEAYRAVDDTTWELKLRSNARFWKGAPVNAAAVKASLERAFTLGDASKPLLRGVTISTADEWTVRLVTERPNPYLPINLTIPILLIHNAASYGDQPNPNNLQAMDLTGPYRMVAFEPKQRMVLEPFDGYWGPRPALSRLTQLQIADQQARVLAAQSGQAQVVRSLAPEGVASVKGNPSVEIARTETPGTSYIHLNTALPMLADERVRQALAWGIDRQEVVDLSLEGFGRPEASWLSSSPTYPDLRNDGYTTYDPDRARQLLDAAGWTPGPDGIRQKDGKPLTIRLMSWGATAPPISEVIQSQWKKIGVALEIQYTAEYGPLDTRRKSGDWDAVIASWGTFGDIAGIGARWFEPSGDVNYAKFEDAATLEAVKAVGSARTDDRRRAAIAQLNRRATEVTTAIPLFSRVQLTVLDKRVRNYELRFEYTQYGISAETALGQ